jgi:hypothetical protein
MTTTEHLLLACAAQALLTLLVGLRMLAVRVAEMKAHRIHPQAVALSAERTTRFRDTRASDNYNHLFELPVLFYTLCAVALGSGLVPGWLPWVAWGFVISRVIHSLIQCTYNKVMHRFLVFFLGYMLLIGAWLGFAAHQLL